LKRKEQKEKTTYTHHPVFSMKNDFSPVLNNYEPIKNGKEKAKHIGSRDGYDMPSNRMAARPRRGAEKRRKNQHKGTFCQLFDRLSVNVNDIDARGWLICGELLFYVLFFIDIINKTNKNKFEGCMSNS
jgi:hypothetical protein